MSSQQGTRAGVVPAERPVRLPRSCTNMAINLTGLAGFFAALVAFALLPEVAATTRTVLCILALVVPIAALELIFRNCPGTGAMVMRCGDARTEFQGSP